MERLSWETLGLLALLLVVGGVLLLAFQSLTVKGVAWLLRKDVARLSAGRPVLRRSLTANFLGQESRGRAQVRGNGALLLTEQDLVFVLAAPRRELIVPLPKVTTTAVVRSHLGKSVLRPLLRVEWRGPEGMEAAAWAVRDPEGWRRDIEAARRHGGEAPGSERPLPSD